MSYRIEKDYLGEKKVPQEAYWGPHTQRALGNFKISGKKTNKGLIKALAMVKKACVMANFETGHLEEDKALSLIKACDEIIDNFFEGQFPLDSLQGGAGTSTNMNMNEVLANRALEIAGRAKGDYEFIDPLKEVNKHQSTNDVYPTAVKVAVLLGLKELSGRIALLQGHFQKKEKEFAKVVKTGRTEMQQAVPMTLGSEFSAFAEAVARDRWRVFKCEERIRTVNLGGTAVGTGIGASRRYIFRVIAKLRDVTGLGVARSENAVDQTANTDNFVEVAGILRAHASNIIKISNDIRMLNMLGEINLGTLQPGSSIMPGKVNPVAFEAAQQGALKASAMCEVVFESASRSSFQINEFMPLLAESILEVLELLNNVDGMLLRNIEAIKADQKKCSFYNDNNVLIITAFVPLLGYEECERLVKEFTEDKERKMSVKQFLIQKLGEETVKEVLCAENVMSLGYRDDEKSA